MFNRKYRRKDNLKAFDKTTGDKKIADNIEINLMNLFSLESSINPFEAE